MDSKKAKEILYKLAGGADYSLEMQEQIHRLVMEDMAEGSRFNVGDDVYILDDDMTITKTRVASRHRNAPEAPVWYNLMEETGRRTGHFREDHIFATPEELVDRVTAYFGAYLKSNGN